MKTYIGFVYVTTDLTNGMRYVGKCMFDKRNRYKSYLGSGKLLVEQVKQKGRENFERTILQFCETKQQLEQAEEKYIRFFNCPKNNDYYNISYQSKGGRIGEYNEERNKKISNVRSQQDICWNRGKTGIYSQETLDKIRVGAIKYYVILEKPNCENEIYFGVPDICEKYGLTRSLAYKMLTNNNYYVPPTNGRNYKFLQQFKGWRLSKIPKEKFLEETSTTIP